VRTLLDRWAAAIRRGDLDQATAYYAPQAREHARQSMRELLRRQPRMDVFRLSDVAITRQQRGEAVASFHERWQSGGSLKFAGEQRVRLVLRHNGDRWQIASEEAQELWTQQAQ
jgi:ketosteroid isomerase-like protein